MLLADGAVGEVLAVHFEWLLDVRHGADYFRRWHREKRHSGGLMVHKSGHHFDLVSWWLDDEPAEVFG
ncbi:Gfo/Idh/MocA family oxidoreductase [Streptomyces sp. NPDC005890]|uniref:Gfo/Idh/MocA family oxidoreductase n=1 Tax=Streptomyces sp. NPDC005890 TaxID=3154568 RepID=UPI0033FC30E9